MTQKARDRLIASTVELIRRNGVAGTGVNEIVAHSGAARRSIYLNFPGGKDELIAAATEFSGRFIAQAISDDAPPAETVRGFIAMWKWTLASSDYRAGCPIAAGALAGPAAPSAPPVAAATFTAWQTKVAAHLRAAGAAEDDAESLAMAAICAIEGAVLVAIAGRSLDPLDAVERYLLELLERHTSPPTG